MPDFQGNFGTNILNGSRKDAKNAKDNWKWSRKDVKNAMENWKWSRKDVKSILKVFGKKMKKPVTFYFSQNIYL